MTTSERGEFIRVLLGVASCYNREPAEETVQMYWDVLKEDLTLDEFREAMKRHVKDPERGRFFPLVADIMNQSQKAKPVEWRQAWQEVITAMEDFGAYSSVLFVNPVTGPVIRSMGGWVHVCRCDLNEPWTERAFEQMYKEFSESGVSDNRYLPGLIELENRRGGHAVPAPDVIGDKRLLLGESETMAPESREMVNMLAGRMGGTQ